MSYPEKTQSLTNEFVHVVVGTWCCVTESMGIFTAVLIIQNVNTLKNYQLKIQGHAISLKETDNCTFVLTKDKNKYKIYAIETPATLIGSFGFEANSAFIQTKGNELYVGKDSTISKILITKK